MLEISNLLNEDLILLDLEAEDCEDAIKKMSSKLIEKGYVKESYKQAILKREQTFPTGLDTGEIKIAIPHTDSTHVIKPGILVAKLKNEIEFKDMGNPSNKLKIKMVFMLAVKDPKAQVPVLTKLMGIFSDQEGIKKIYESKTEKELLNSILNTIDSKK